MRLRQPPDAPSLRAKETVKRYAPVDASDFCADAVGPQQVTHPSMGTNDTERNATSVKFAVHFVQHLRAGEVEVG